MTNKNWQKVLGSEVTAVVLTLGVFFGYQKLGVEIGLGVLVFFLALGAFVAIGISFAPVPPEASGTSFITAIAAICILFIFVARITAGFIGVILAIGFVVASAAELAESYGLSKLLVMVTYMTEAAAIFFPIYLSLN